MEDYDVIVIGGGINGLTAAGYCAKSGLKTLVLEARGECGTHCDSVEHGIPGFVHNTHATMLLHAMSPAMADLDLPGFGLETVGTEHVYAHTFLDGKNAILSTDPMYTAMNFEKHSAKDAGILGNATEFLLSDFDHLMEVMHRFAHAAPSQEILDEFGSFLAKFAELSGIDVTFDQMWNMNGFELTDTLFESEHIRMMLASCTWIMGAPPVHKNVGSLGTFLALMLGTLIPVHNCRGGSHMLAHSLVKAATAYGAKILPCCPIRKIIVENNEAKSVVLSDHAVFPNEKIFAKKIISDLTLVPTFLEMIGEDAIGREMAQKISRFDYDEQNLFCLNLALNAAPQFISAEFDEGIQQSFEGYFGGESIKQVEAANRDLVNKVIHDIPIANYFIPTWADPTQAPAGCHTAILWLDVPPAPKSWKHGALNGFDCWDDIKEQMADELVDEFEKYAPGFKKSILERLIYTPLDIYRNNPSAIHGNWIGGSNIPEQFYMNRPLPGVLERDSASRTFVKNLYLSNSINAGQSSLSGGYVAAVEAVKDMEAYDSNVFKAKTFEWLMENVDDIPKNLGVR